MENKDIDLFVKNCGVIKEWLKSEEIDATDTQVGHMALKLQETLLSERARLVELLEDAKRKDTDPLHSYMPSVWNDALGKAISIIKESEVTNMRKKIKAKIAVTGYIVATVYVDKDNNVEEIDSLDDYEFDEMEIQTILDKVW